MLLSALPHERKNYEMLVSHTSSWKTSSKSPLLARRHARTLQRFCTFCFHNLHTHTDWSPLYSFIFKELWDKKSEISRKKSNVFVQTLEILSKTSEFFPNTARKRTLQGVNLHLRAISSTKCKWQFSILFSTFFLPFWAHRSKNANRF